MNHLEMHSIFLKKAFNLNIKTVGVLFADNNIDINIIKKICKLDYDGLMIDTVKKSSKSTLDIMDDNLINFTIVENDNEINVFFDNETFNLVGWKTRDIYQNNNVTYLSSIETNKEITKNLFKIPSQN